MQLSILHIILLCFISQAAQFWLSSALECKTNPQDPSQVAYTITVSQSGGGNFTTVTDAVNSIHPDNDQWVKIAISPGTYNEQIKITQPCIIMEGQDRSITTITSDHHQSPIESPTVFVQADNFVANGITFENSYSIQTPAVALAATGDKQAYYSCGFKGLQDTLWDQQGRHYFKSCYIEGVVDFIWGDGQSVYEQCDIQIKGDGSITAQGRGSASEINGYVFRECNVKGTGLTTLGRAYNSFSRVIYQDSNFDNVIRPEGWDIWEQHGHEEDVTYAEVNCKGPGADTSHRVPWLKHLSGSDLDQYTTQNFIDQDGWIEKLPVSL